MDFKLNIFGHYRFQRRSYLFDNIREDFLEHGVRWIELHFLIVKRELDFEFW
jgi:hypothetical protein